MRKMYNVCLSSLEHPIRAVCKQESMPAHTLEVHTLTHILTHTHTHIHSCTQLEPVVLVLRVEQLILSAERPSQITAAVRKKISFRLTYAYKNTLAGHIPNYVKIKLVFRLPLSPSLSL